MLNSRYGKSNIIGAVQRLCHTHILPPLQPQLHKTSFYVLEIMLCTPLIDNMYLSYQGRVCVEGEICQSLQSGHLAPGCIMDSASYCPD